MGISSYFRRWTCMLILSRALWSWWYGSWIYNNLSNQCLSPLKLWFRTPFIARCIRYNIMLYSLWVTGDRGRWFSPCTPVSYTNKTDRHDITEILLKVALNTINQPDYVNCCLIYNWDRKSWQQYTDCCYLMTSVFRPTVLPQEQTRIFLYANGSLFNFLFFFPLYYDGTVTLMQKCKNLYTRYIHVL